MSSDLQSKYFAPVTAADPNGICQDQTNSSGAALSLNGALQSASATIPFGTGQAQKITIEGSGNNAGITFVIVGTDSDGVANGETITGPNNATVTSVNFYQKIVSITSSGAVTGNVEVGNVGTAVFTVNVGRTRLKGFTGTGGDTAGDFIFRNASTTGTVKFQQRISGAIESVSYYMPEDGIVFKDGLYLESATDVADGINILFTG